MCSVRWLLSNTAVSSICAMDWCPIVNASVDTQQELAASRTVSITVPGHVLLPDESCKFQAIIDTNVAVFNLDYPPLFPERPRELPEVQQHLKSIGNLLVANGLAFLLCRSAAVLSVVVSHLEPLSLHVVWQLRCANIDPRKYSDEVNGVALLQSRLKCK